MMALRYKLMGAAGILAALVSPAGHAVWHVVLRWLGVPCP